MDTEKAKLALEDIASRNRLITVVNKYDQVFRYSPSYLHNFHQMNRWNGYWDNIDGITSQGHSIDILYDLIQEYMSKNPGKKIRS